MQAHAQGAIRVGQRKRWLKVSYPGCSVADCSNTATVSISKAGATKHVCTEHLHAAPKIPRGADKAASLELLKKYGLA